MNEIETGNLNVGRNKFHSINGQVALPMEANRRTFFVLDAKPDEGQALGYRIAVYKLVHMVANIPMSRSNGRACWIATNADDGVEYTEGMTTNQIVANVRNSNANAMEFLNAGFNGLSISNGKLAHFPVPVGPKFGQEWYTKANGLAMKALSLYKGFDALLSGSAFISHDKNIVTANEDENGTRVPMSEDHLRDMMKKIVVAYNTEVKGLIEKGALATSTAIYVGANGISPCIVPIANAVYKANGGKDVRTTPRAYGRIKPNYHLSITGEADITDLEQDQLHEGYLAGVQMTTGDNATQYCRKFVNFTDSRGNAITVRAVMYSNSNNGRGQTRAEAFENVSANASDIFFTEGNVLGFESRTPLEDEEDGQPWIVTARINMDGYRVSNGDTAVSATVVEVDLDSIGEDELDLGEVDIFADTARAPVVEQQEETKPKGRRRGQAKPAATGEENDPF